MSARLQTVGHYIHNYLSLTEGWMGDQMRFLRSFRPLVLAVRRVSEAATDPREVVSLDDAPLPRHLWNELVRAARGYAPMHAEAARRSSIVLLHAHFGDRGVQALPLARAVGVPLVTSFYGRDMWKSSGGVDSLRRRYRGLFAGGDVFLAEGPAARARLIDIGCPPEKTKIHPLGVDVSAIEFHARAVTPSTPLRLLMAARFVEKKGLEYGLRAFSAVAANDARVRLTIVGDAGRSADEVRVKEQLVQLARESPGADRIEMLGFVPKTRLMELAAEHHILLQPSVTAADGDSEGGFPVAMTELAASGMPIIATRHCDIPELVREGETGWLAAERDVEGLAAAIADAMQRPEEVTRRGANARAHVERHYDGRRTTLDDVYSSLLSTRA